MAALRLFVLILICSIFQSIRTKDIFHEELFIKPLFSGHVFSYFQFTTIWDADARANPCKF